MPVTQQDNDDTFVKVQNDVDTGNSSTSTLTAGSTFTGTWLDVLRYGMVSVTLNASHASATSGVKIEWSTNGSDIDADDLYTYTSGGKQWTFGINAQYFRVRYTNGGTNQTSFHLQVVLHPIAHKPSSHRIADSVTDEDDAELGLTVVKGRKPDGSYATAAMDSDGNLIVASQAASANGGFNFGIIQTSGTTEVAVQKTTYTEQSSNAQRSIVSTSANDSSAGTGARTVRLTYYTATFTGPFTEDITMNGTTAVNTTATDICYIELIEVLTVGSTGSNVGTLNLKTTTGGGGSTFASIAATDNQTFFAHHYIATGQTAYITGVSLSNDKSSIDSGAVFRLRALSLNTSNAVNTQITEYLRYFAQDSTYTRVYPSPVTVPGPARILAYVTPDNGTTMNNRCAFDFYEKAS